MSHGTSAGTGNRQGTMKGQGHTPPARAPRTASPVWTAPPPPGPSDDHQRAAETPPAARAPSSPSAAPNIPGARLVTSATDAADKVTRAVRPALDKAHTPTTPTATQTGRPALDQALTPA